MHPPHSTGLVWLRRDLRLRDNTALQHALQNCRQVHCVFVLDDNILATLPRADRRVEFILASLAELDSNLRALSGRKESGLIVLRGRPQDLVPQLAQQIGATAVFAARDYEPYAQDRDAEVALSLGGMGSQLLLAKDHVILEQRELLTQTGKPYSVFTPYWRAWLARLATALPHAAENTELSANTQLAERPTDYCNPTPTLADLGFLPTNLSSLAIPTGEQGAQQLLNAFTNRLDQYDETRNFPAIKGPSYLGVHLRFGTVSIRQLVALGYAHHLAGSTGATTWLSELAWRDFYFQILANFPHAAHGAFKPEYDQIAWEEGTHAEQLFAAWCQGLTGYPIVDAAMAQLNTTGYMHNRLRMVAGSFLVKHLGIDWRWGERYFAQQLNDFDLAANNGGWQWVSSSGCDAQPYFRIFNPMAQSERFDPEGKFIRRYLPQLAGLDSKAIHAPWTSPRLVLAAAGVRLGDNYPQPLVDHTRARARTLLRYGAVKKAV
ncbi:MAG: deoxyribodipyrimidine photo-lyase [Rhodoferax sp.]|nr:deoxyribodipyrimidine photo-lyase [Rhodoferax sp.]